MADIVGAISMSHAPGMIGWPESIDAVQRGRMEVACAKISAYLVDRRPDVLVAFLDDHFENIYRSMSPTFAVAVAETHSGPPEYWQQVLRLRSSRRIGGQPSLATHILNSTIRNSFDTARMGSVEFGNNLIVPLELIRPAYDIPVVPVFINVYHPPLPSLARAYDFGAAVRKAIDDFPSALRVAFLGTGGLSHWPPLWLEHIHGTEDSKLSPTLRKMRRFQTEGRPVLSEYPELMNEMGQFEQEMARHSKVPIVNPEWDRAFLGDIASGNIAGIKDRSYEDTEHGGGFGGHEILNWAAVMGSMGGSGATVLDYQEVPEWITGIGYAIYE